MFEVIALMATLKPSPDKAAQIVGILAGFKHRHHDDFRPDNFRGRDN